MRKLLTIFATTIFLTACGYNTKPTDTPLTIPPLQEESSENQQLPSPTMQPTLATQSALAKSAIISTSMGDITVKLYPDKTPVTVSNFVGLAQGSINWVSPTTGEETNGQPLYNNTIFHRVIPDFMIQGGDPLGTGTGGPGYKFKDEIVPDLTFDKPYLLAMANAGPNTNGSQFFITVAATPWLTGKHTIFGEVTTGQDVVDKIATTPTDSSDKPLTNITIKTIQIIR